VRRGRRQREAETITVGGSPAGGLSPTRVKEPVMKAKVVEDADVVTYVVVCDPGDEAVAALTQFARSEQLEAAQITAVGAF
jgi:hypothetical protein